MSRFFKSAAFPILIVIVLAFFASKLISGQDRSDQYKYGDFLVQLDEVLDHPGSKTSGSEGFCVRVAAQGLFKVLADPLRRVGLHRAPSD